jgi:hypothetical protein
VDVFNGYLKAIEASGLWRCDLRREVTTEVFVDDAIRCGEEGEDVGDEVAFIGVEAGPICGVSLEVNLFGGPE